MQVSGDAEGRSKCVPRLHGPCRAPASRLAGQDSGELRAGHFSREVERDSPGYQHHSASMNRPSHGNDDVVDFPAFCGRAKLTALPARRNADAYESEYGEDPSDLRIYQSQPESLRGS